jgi:carbon storage regulator CsrA
MKARIRRSKMLVLSCTSHQSVIIDGVIKVTVLYNKRGQVVLGIDAPDGVEVHREEVDPQAQEIEKPQNVSL